MATILVIENEDFVRENILELLDAEGFLALGAADGFQGVALARQCRPDLILCDVLMPEFSGYDVLESIRAQPQLAHVPFVFLSARTSQEDTSMGLGSGADYYLSKPFSIHDLLAVIQYLIGRSA